MSSLPTIHQHPLAYLLGLEGVALMRAFAGEQDGEFVAARLDEIRNLLDRADELGDGQVLKPLDTSAAYDAWSPRYDTPDNPFFAMDEAVLLPILDGIPPGAAVDAACGTGRYAAHLRARGHEVRGFDVSPAMLAVARRKVSGASFGEAAMAALPVDDESVGVVVNALALTHVQDLEAALREAARVLRPDGHLLVSDVRGYFVGSPLSLVVEEDGLGGFGYIPCWDHGPGDYVRAALASGLSIRACHELVAEVSPDENAGDPAPPEAPFSIWDLHPWVPEAAHAVRDDRCCLAVWHFQKA